MRPSRSVCGPGRKGTARQGSWLAVVSHPLCSRSTRPVRERPKASACCRDLRCKAPTQSLATRVRRPRGRGVRRSSSPC
eukprot:2007811-Prymnesium_polylepis.1